MPETRKGRKLKRKRPTQPTSDDISQTAEARNALIIRLAPCIHQPEPLNLPTWLERVIDDMEYYDSYHYAVAVREGSIRQRSKNFIFFEFPLLTADLDSQENTLACHRPLLQTLSQRGATRGVVTAETFLDPRMKTTEYNGLLLYVPTGLLDLTQIAYPCIFDAELELRTAYQIASLLEKGLLIITSNPSLVHEDLPSIAFIPMHYKTYHKKWSKTRCRPFEEKARQVVNSKIRIEFSSQYPVHTVINTVLFATTKLCTKVCVAEPATTFDRF